MERIRELEVIAANALLKTVSDRLAPGTHDRILNFLADRGAVSGVVEEYHATGDLERSCLTYWNAKLEPNALRLEDLVSALLISFCTSLAASILIEGGKAAFPILYGRLAYRNELDRKLADLSKLEAKRKEHVDSLLILLNRKADAIKLSQVDLLRELTQVRTSVLGGSTIRSFVGEETYGRDLALVESVVRGVMLTEEQRESGFEAKSPVTLKGLPLTSYFGIGQIVENRIEALDTGKATETICYDVESFRRDVFAPLRDAHKHFYMREALGRPPKKVIPVADHDLNQLLDHPSIFMECRDLIGALVLRYGGMTCHMAVLSRGMGIPCIQLNQNEFLKLSEWQFGAVQEGTIMLWQTLPADMQRFL